MNTLKVNNLNISGFLNEHLIEDLVNQPEIELQNNYQELNVNNMVVDGLVNEYNITKLFKDSEKLEIQGIIIFRTFVPFTVVLPGTFRFIRFY